MIKISFWNTPVYFSLGIYMRHFYWCNKWLLVNTALSVSLPHHGIFPSTDQTNSGWGEEAADCPARSDQVLPPAGPEGGRQVTPRQSQAKFKLVAGETFTAPAPNRNTLNTSRVDTSQSSLSYLNLPLHSRFTISLWPLPGLELVSCSTERVPSAVPCW